MKRRYLLGAQLDSVMNYPFREAIINYIKGMRSRDFRHAIMTILENYPKPTVDVLMNFVSTHDIERAINRFGGENCDDKSNLMVVMQRAQDIYGYLPFEVQLMIAEGMDVPLEKVYGVATFYNQFRFSAQGKYHIQICRGTACHVKGSAAILDALVRELKINPGETTRDGLFSLEIVACIGACGLAPVMNISNNFHAKLTTQSIPGIIKEYRKQATEA